MQAKQIFSDLKQQASNRRFKRKNVLRIHKKTISIYNFV
jgi:hypothetical protein